MQNTFFISEVAVGREGEKRRLQTRLILEAIRPIMNEFCFHFGQINLKLERDSRILEA